MKRVTMVATYDRTDATPTHRALMASSSVTRAAVLVWGPAANVTTLSWFDADRAAVASLLADVASVTGSYLVADDGGTYAFLDRDRPEFDPVVFEHLAAEQLVFVPPIRFGDDGTATFEAVGEQASISRFYDAISGVAPVTIRAVEPIDRYGRGVAPGPPGQRASPDQPAPLTDRQRAALSVGVEVGYYDCPRTGSVADVADELDCAHSTAGELLRRAESTVVRGFVGGLTRRRR